MIEYRPWSRLELSRSFEKYQRGILSVLDIEVSGCCNFNCVYCDSPDHSKKCMIDVSNIEKILASSPFDWVFICGLGEPTAGGNYRFFMDILHLCEKYNVMCSVFSNGYVCNEEIINYIDKGILHFLFKYDCTDFKLNANIYGTSNAKAKRQNTNIKTLLKHVHCENNMTNMGASIVPTKLNVGQIPQIVEECCRNNVYPLIGDLENSGRGQDHFSALSLSDDELRELKKDVESIIGEKYYMPVCPAVIAGIHISNNSDIVVDKISGLTCPWFWLEEPCLYTILKLNSETTLEEIRSNLLKYRNQQLDKVQELQATHSSADSSKFGGCGGDIKSLLDIYIKIQKSLKEMS